MLAFICSFDQTQGEQGMNWQNCVTIDLFVNIEVYSEFLKESIS